MPNVILSPTNFQFPVGAPGGTAVPPLDVALGVQLVGEESKPISVPISLAFKPISTELFHEFPFVAGVFRAQLQQSALGQRGPVQPVVLAYTGGGPGPSTTLQLTSFEILEFKIVVTFAPPPQPLPGLFTADLLVSGWGGTATVTLTATTGQLTATATLVGTDGVFHPTN